MLTVQTTVRLVLAVQFSLGSHLPSFTTSVPGETLAGAAGREGNSSLSTV